MPSSLWAAQETPDLSEASSPLVAPTPPQTRNLQTAPPLQWYLDRKGGIALSDILAPQSEANFAPYTLSTLPRRAGTIWFRASLAPLAETNPWIKTVPIALDLNARVVNLVPGVPRIWLLSPSSPEGTALQPDKEGLFHLPSPLPEQATLLMRISGLPGLGFEPLLRPLAPPLFDNLPVVQGLLSLLGIALAICLLRGVAERKEWRLWASLYITAVLVHEFWGLPSTPTGQVSLWDMPGLLAPAVALLLLPHLGRHLMRTRELSPLLDMQLILLGLPATFFAIAPLFPGYTWLLQYMPLWPLFMLLLLPTTLAACIQKRHGAKRFLFMILLPPLGLLGLYPFSIEGLPAEILSVVPLASLVLTALWAAFTTSPQVTAPSRRGPAGKKFQPRDKGSELSLSQKTAPALLKDAPLSLSDEQETSDLPMPSPVERPAPERRASQPHPLQTSLPLHVIEETLRTPLDALLRTISALDQSYLNAEARRHADALNLLGSRLARLIGNIPQEMATSTSSPVHESFDLNQLLKETHDAVQQMAESRNLALSWFVAPHLARRYEGPRGQLAEVLRLLAESSVLATKRGLIQIRAQRVPDSTDPGHIMFSMVDSGQGSPPNTRSTLAFVRAWELIGPLGGSISLESDPTGTTISFCIQLVALLMEQRPLVPSSASGAHPFSSLPVNPLRIIIASGISANRQILAYYLDELPHEILETRSAEEALHTYRKAPGALIVFDDDIPETDIVKAVAEIRDFEGEYGFPLASILALVHDPSQAEHFRRAGCTHTLTHPISRKDLRHLALRLAPVPRRYNQAVKETPLIPPMPEEPVSSVSTPPREPIIELETPLAAPRSAPIPALKTAPPSLSESRAPLADLELPSPEPQRASRVQPPQPEEQDDILELTTTVPQAPKPVDSLPSLDAPAPEVSSKPKRGLLGSLFSFGHQKSAPVSDVVIIPNKIAPSVGEPTPIPLSQKASSPVPKDKPKPPRPTLENRIPKEHSSAPDDVTEWVGEPMPILKKTPVAPPVDAEEWVGEPVPIMKPQPAPNPSVPVSSHTPEASPSPISEQEPEPSPQAPDKGSSPLSLSTPEEPPFEPLMLPGHQDDTDEPITDLSDPIDTISMPESSLPSVNTLEITPTHEFKTHRQTPHPAPTLSIDPDLDDHDEILTLDNVVEPTSVPDPATETLLRDLDSALHLVLEGYEQNSPEAVQAAVESIAHLADEFGLRELSDPAHCMALAAQSGNMEEVGQIMPDLTTAVERNKASFM